MSQWKINHVFVSHLTVRIIGHHLTYLERTMSGDNIYLGIEQLTVYYFFKYKNGRNWHWYQHHVNVRQKPENILFNYIISIILIV